MPRPSKPWYWRARKRWAVTVGGKRKLAPRHIGPGDLVEIGLWWEQVQRGTEPVTIGSTVAELCEAYGRWDAARVAAGQRSADGHETLSARLTRALGTRIGNRRLGDHSAGEIRAGHLEGLILRWLAEGFSVNYARDLASAVKVVFAWGAREIGGNLPILSRNPLAGLKLPISPAPAPRYATRQEAAEWLRWLRRQPDVPRSYILLQRCMIHTGARPSEWAWAKVGDVADMTTILTRSDWKAARKTGRVRRVFVPIRLRRAIARSIRDRDGDSPLFLSPRGKRWQSDSLAAATKRYRRRAIVDGAKLIRDDGAERLTCYRWRHTAISSLLMDGVPTSTVAELTGTSVAMIERNYKHLLSRHLADAAEVLARRR